MTCGATRLVLYGGVPGVGVADRPVEKSEESHTHNAPEIQMNPNFKNPVSMIDTRLPLYDIIRYGLCFLRIREQGGIGGQG